MPPKKKMSKPKITQKIATRLIEISLLVDGYIYNKEPISVEDAKKYAKEVARFEPKCHGDVRSLQVIEKLTRFMKTIMNEQIQSQQNNSLPTCGDPLPDSKNSRLPDDKTSPTTETSPHDRTQSNLEKVQADKFPVVKNNDSKEYKDDKNNTLNDLIDDVDLDRTLSNLSISLIDPQQKDFLNVFNSVTSSDSQNKTDKKDTGYSFANIKEAMDSSAVHPIKQNQEKYIYRDSLPQNTDVEETQYNRSCSSNTSNLHCYNKQQSSLNLSQNIGQNASDASMINKITSTICTQNISTLSTLSQNIHHSAPIKRNNKGKSLNDTMISQNLQQNTYVEPNKYTIGNGNEGTEYNTQQQNSTASITTANINNYLEKVQKNTNKHIEHDVMQEKISAPSYNEMTNDCNASLDMKTCNDKGGTTASNMTKVRKTRKPKETKPKEKKQTQNIKNNQPVKKRGRKRKNNIFSELNSKNSENNVIDLSWIENIKLVRVIDADEYERSPAVDDAFWYNCSLPDDWSEEYFTSDA